MFLRSSENTHQYFKKLSFTYFILESYEKLFLNFSIEIEWILQTLKKSAFEAAIFVSALMASIQRHQNQGSYNIFLDLFQKGI